MRSFDDLKSKIKFDKNYRILLGIVPMILTPRWFFVNIQKELEKAGGLKLAKEVYYRAGFESAYKYCQTLRKAEEIEGSHTVQAYLDSMSLRGWGKFKIVLLDEERGKGFFDFTNQLLAKSMVRWDGWFVTVGLGRWQGQSKRSSMPKASIFG